MLNWALYTDWRLDPRHDRDVSLTNNLRHTIHQGRFANLFSDLDLRPRSWLTLNSQIRFDVESGNFREAYHAVTVQPNNVWSASVSYRYLANNDPALVDPFLLQYRNPAGVPSTFFD